MPQQGIVQNAAKNAAKEDGDQADLEASTKQEPADQKGASMSAPQKAFDEKSFEKLTRAEKGELVDQILKVVRWQDLSQGLFT